MTLKRLPNDCYKEELKFDGIDDVCDFSYSTLNTILYNRLIKLVFSTMEAEKTGKYYQMAEISVYRFDDKAKFQGKTVEELETEIFPKHCFIAQYYRSEIHEGKDNGQVFVDGMAKYNEVIQHLMSF